MKTFVNLCRVWLIMAKTLGLYKYACCALLVISLNYKCVYIQMVKLLLNKGANLSAIDKKERQPIHWAAYLGGWLHN